MRDVLCEESQGKMFFGKRGGVIKRWMGRLQRGENEDFFLLHKWKTKASDYWNFKEFKELYALLSAALELHVLLEKTFKVRGTVSPMRWEGETGSVIPVLWRVSAFLHIWGASLECPLHLIPFPIRNKTAFRSLHRSFSVSMYAPTYAPLSLCSHLLLRWPFQGFNRVYVEATGRRFAFPNKPDKNNKSSHLCCPSYHISICISHANWTL